MINFTEAVSNPWHNNNGFIQTSSISAFCALKSQIDKIFYAVNLKSFTFKGKKFKDFPQQIDFLDKTRSKGVPCLIGIFMGTEGSR